MTDVTGTLTAVRFFTALDVYHYTVDNRPLQDLKQRDDVLAQAVDAGTNANNLSDLATAYVARGYSTQNMMVGKVAYPAGFVRLAVTRSFLVQEVAIGPDTLPRIGLNTDGKNLDITPPAIGLVLPVSIQARVVNIPGSPTVPFVDPANPYTAGSGQIGEIEWQVVTGTAVSSSPVYPSVVSGYVEVFRVLVPSGATAIDPSWVTIRQWRDEGVATGSTTTGVYEYNTYRYVATGGETVIGGVPINCYYAFIFVDGLMQQHDTVAIPGSVTIDSASQVTFPEALPAGAVVDFVSTAGGKADIAQYGTKQWHFVATAGQTAFTPMAGGGSSSVVFINGIYQPSGQGAYTINTGTQTLTTSEALELNDRVDVIEFQVISTTIPAIPGGTTGQVLAKDSNNDYDYSWVTNSAVPNIPGGTTHQVLAKASNTDNDFMWLDRTIVRPKFCCTLSRISNSVITLQPYGGRDVIVNGVIQQLPIAGVSYTLTTLTDGLYNVFLEYATGPGTFSLTLSQSNSTTAALEKTTFGYWVADGAVHRTFVGAAYVGGNAFASFAQPGVTTSSASTVVRSTLFMLHPVASMYNPGALDGEFSWPNNQHRFNAVFATGGATPFTAASNNPAYNIMTGATFILLPDHNYELTITADTMNQGIAGTALTTPNYWFSNPRFYQFSSGSTGWNTLTQLNAATISPNVATYLGGFFPLVTFPANTQRTTSLPFSSTEFQKTSATPTVFHTRVVIGAHLVQSAGASGGSATFDNNFQTTATVVDRTL